MAQIIQTVFSERAQLNERRDCTVRALAACTGMSYTEAHAMCAKHGRKPKKGFDPAVMVERLVDCGFTVRKVRVEEPTVYRRTNLFYGTSRVCRRGGDTVQSFLSRLPDKGAFYICSTSHAFAYVDGAVRDMGKIQNRARVCYAYEVTKAETSLAQADINAMWERLNVLAKKF